MILGFKKQFVQPIFNGRKIHTIREDKGGRWAIGKKIHFATGVRTKNYHQFKTGLCYRTQTIEIRYDNKDSDYPAVIIDGWTHRVYHRPNKILQVAMNDGFKNLNDFFKWFNSDFKGKIIHWTDFIYQ